MKAVHWVIFSIAAWIVMIPFIADEIFSVLFPATDQTDGGLIKLLMWDDFFLGIAVVVLSLVVVTAEQASEKTAGLKAMHWLQILLGFWIALSPFALSFEIDGFSWSHVVAGSFVAIFALLQINLEHSRK